MRLILIFILLLSRVPVEAQELYAQIETYRIDLYLGYVNVIRANINNEDKQAQHTFQATATGAVIDYTPDGRMSVLPQQKNGHIDIYAEVKGIPYLAGKIRFEAIKPPPADDAVFIDVMGITKDDPKTALKTKKVFDPGSGEIHRSPKISLAGFPIRNFRAEMINAIRVSILRGGEKYATPVKGTIELASKDAEIRKVDDNTFNVQPLPGRQTCSITILLDGKKVSDERFDVIKRE